MYRTLENFKADTFCVLSLLKVLFSIFQKNSTFNRKKSPWKVKCTVRLIESTEYLLSPIFAVIESKWKGSIFNTYSDIWPSVHRYTYIIVIALEVWLNMLTRYVCETLVLCEIFLSILALETTNAVKTFLYICSIIGCKAYVCFCGCLLM